MSLNAGHWSLYSREENPRIKDPARYTAMSHAQKRLTSPRFVSGAGYFSQQSPRYSADPPMVVLNALLFVRGAPSLVIRIRFARSKREWLRSGVSFASDDARPSDHFAHETSNQPDSQITQLAANAYTNGYEYVADTIYALPFSAFNARESCPPEHRASLDLHVASVFRELTVFKLAVKRSISGSALIRMR